MLLLATLASSPGVINFGDFDVNGDSDVIDDDDCDGDGDFDEDILREKGDVLPLHNIKYGKDHTNYANKL